MEEGRFCCRRTLIVAAILVAAGAADRASAAEAPLQLEATIALPDTRGRIDHMAIDLKRRRLIVAELGNDTVDVIDLAAGRRVARIAGLAEPQGVGHAAGADRYAVATAGDGKVRLYRAEDVSPVGVVELGDDADNIRIDPRDGAVLVGYGRGGIAMIDPAAAAKTATVALPAHPEGFRLDPASGRIYVNLPDAHRIAVVDSGAGQVVAEWPTGALAGNFPMALDAAGAVVATVFRNPPSLALYDAKSGAALARLATCGDADDVFFDDQRRRLYVSCGAGVIDVIAAEGGAYRQTARIATASGARTSLFVPELDRLYVAERSGLLGGAAAIKVFRPLP